MIPPLISSLNYKKKSHQEGISNVQVLGPSENLRVLETSSSAPPAERTVENSWNVIKYELYHISYMNSLFLFFLASFISTFFYFDEDSIQFLHFAIDFWACYIRYFIHFSTLSCHCFLFCLIINIFVKISLKCGSKREFSNLLLVQLKRFLTRGFQKAAWDSNQNK